MSKRLTKNEFVEKSIKKHGDRYGYDKTVYTDTKTKVEIFCTKCKKYFWQTPNCHLNGHGCGICNVKDAWNLRKLKSDEFIKRAKENHSIKYGYEKMIYIDTVTKIEIFCPKCKKYFWQTPEKHQVGQGCPTCRIMTGNEFIIKSNKIHGIYGYGKVDYKDFYTKVEIFCPKCQKYFWQTPQIHLTGSGCSRCNQSKLERMTEKYLIEKNIKYKIQKKFKGCKDKIQLSFDFQLPDKNTLIECQGQQHYGPRTKIMSGLFTPEQAIENFKDQLKKDNIKREYAKKHGIKLIEIKYDEIKKIPEILDRELFATPEVQNNMINGESIPSQTAAPEFEQKLLDLYS